MLNLGTKFLLASSVILGGFSTIAPAFAQTATAPPIFDSITIKPNVVPNPTGLRGVSGGPMSASHRSVANRVESPTGPCVGYVDLQPNHRMTLTSFFNDLRLEVQSPADTTLVVKGPGGSWCNDDAGGSKNPAIAGQWQPGIYSIWVGSYENNEYHPYILKITPVD